MAAFDVLRHEHGEAAGADGCVSTDPHWVLAVIRYAFPLTVSRKKLTKINSKQSLIDTVSFRETSETISKTRKTLVITSDCLQLSVNSAKSNHTPTLEAVLAGDTNYLAEILPGDWILAWIVNGRNKFQEIVTKINNIDNFTDKAPNGFDDGLKFVGRVHGIRKTLAQTPEGLRTVRHHLQGVGFSELDSQFFFDPHLQRNVPSIGQYLGRLQIQLNDIFEAASAEARKGNGGISSNLVIPALLKIFIGEGIPAENFRASHLKTAEGPISTDEAPYAYGVPEAVGKLLGVTAKSKEKGMLSYADLLSVILGLQKYTSTQNNPTIFFPENTITGTQASGTNDTTNRFFTGYPLKGSFLPAAQDFNQKTTWTLLTEFLNTAINEMYTAFKYTPAGVVMPTLVVRQLPFSSPILTETLGNEATSFCEVPRWRVHPQLIRVLDVGRRDAERFNFIHVHGYSPAKEAASITSQIVRNPPIRDEQDIKRNGLRLHMTTVNCSAAETRSGPDRWMRIVADYLLGQQLALNGTASLVGIQSPICPGDNLEIDDTVYHIESVTHNCGISDGQKTFTTGVTLSYGIRADLDPSNARIPKTKKEVVKKSPGNKNYRLEAALQRLEELKKQKDKKAYNKALQESGSAIQEAILAQDKEEIEVTDDGQNPDLYMYSGIHMDDTRGYDPNNTEEKEIIEEVDLDEHV